jgi:hypothetical protein
MLCPQLAEIQCDEPLAIDGGAQVTTLGVDDTIVLLAKYTLCVLLPVGNIRCGLRTEHLIRTVSGCGKISGYPR